MWQLASAIGEIALRRRGPDSLPDSTFLVAFLLAVAVFLSLLVLALHDNLNTLRLMDLAAQIVLLFAFVFAALAFFKLERRYRQTMSAILGISCLILLIHVPLALGALALDIDLAESDVFFVIGLALLLWSILIEATIIARALSQPLILGFMIEFLYVLTSQSVTLYFSPTVE